MSVDEQRLIRLAQHGDLSALAELLRLHYSFLGKYLLKVTLQPHLADDLTQETMLKAMEKIKLYNGRSKFSSWLITIATRLYIDAERKKKRERRYLEQEQALRTLRWQLERQGEEWSDVLDSLGQLSHDIRLPVLLKHYYGYTYDEIADMMGIPPGTVKSRINRGVLSLRKGLANDDTE